jgi:hypothetical protein
LRSLRSLAREGEVGRTVVALPIAVLLPSLRAEDMWTKWSGESSFSKAASARLSNLAPTSSMSLSSSGRYGCLLVLRGAWGEGGRC